MITRPFGDEIEYLTGNEAAEAIIAYLTKVLHGPDKLLVDSLLVALRAVVNLNKDTADRLIPELSDGWKYASLHEMQNGSWSAIIHLTRITHPYAEEHRWGRGETINAACMDAIGKI